MTVSPGRVAARVQGADGSTYDTVVHVEALTAMQWGRFLDELGAKGGHIAALLDRDMPVDLVDAAQDAGVPLLPGPGDFEATCSCGEIDPPCRHASALCYQVARLLDEDPFVFMLLRGRAESEVLDQLQQRRPIGNQGAAMPPATLASDAYRRAADPLPPLPPLPPVPQGEPQRVDVPSALGVDRLGIAWLVADSAGRAREWLVTGEPPPQLDAWRDTVRLAATHRNARLFARLRDACGRPDELARAARAWEYGGASGLDVLESPRTLTRRELVAASVSVAAAWDEVDAPAFAAAGNRWILVGRGLQIRYGKDARWYPYRDEGGEWWPAGPPQSDPALALADLL